MLVPIFFSVEISKSFDYMPKMLNKVVSVDLEGGGCMVGLSGLPPIYYIVSVEKLC